MLKGKNGVLSVDVLGPFGEGGADEQGLGFGWQKDWQGSTYAFTIAYDGTCKFLEARDGWFEREIGKIENFNPGKRFHTVMVVVRNEKPLGMSKTNSARSIICPITKAAM
jgi:hypothetical protein